MTSRAWLASSVGLLALAASTPVCAQSDPLLSQAYDALTQGRYAVAVNASGRYLSTHPRRYTADFIHAAGECGLHPGSPAAVAQMEAVRDGYDLTPAAASDVSAWLRKCQKAPVAYRSPAPSGDVGESSSALTAPPAPAGATSARPDAPQPRSRPPMGGLVPATSYSGDDYANGPAASAAECSHRCLVQAPCRSMTYDTYAKICWLKRSVPPAQHGANFVSAVKAMPISAAAAAARLP
jgi:hypothetical protein